MKMLEDNKDFRNSVKDMSLNELIFIKKLGVGQFSQVFLVKRAKSGEYYALKAISLHQITQEALEKHTLQEKEVLEMVNFPFIMKMYRTFKDTNFVYFLLSFVRGMELFDVIRQMGILSSP
jgi:cGMP-dependent protein kinase